MSVSWTNEQKQVIDLRDRNLLVSAAAGSGKTAVLVERIIGLITDPKHPVDIDRLLVVTFTKAAAAEMRERISAAIEKRRELAPEDENLLRQTSLIHNAQICTIDSFCSFVVHNHFGEIGLDPNFRIADTGELALIHQDVLDELFEEQFAEGRHDFLHLIDSYSSKRSAGNVKDMVSHIFRMSQSCPWPKAWIKGLAAGYEAADPDSLKNSPIVRGCVDQIHRQMEAYLDQIILWQSLAEEKVGLYAEQLGKDRILLEEGMEIADYEKLAEWLGKVEFPALPKAVGKAAKGIDKEVKDQILKGRNKLKEKLGNLAEEYASASLEHIGAQMKRLYPHVQELSRLAIAYIDALNVWKTRHRIAEFADVEHYALQILVDEETKQPTQTAEEFRHHYDYIMIDEYQDSNQVQEEILTAVSRMSHGEYNLFMVGDVKQSIYRFRQARPELFMEKYHSYTTEDSDCQKIELHKNFRSRNEVLSFTNDMFVKLMAPDLGNILYDDAAALYPGASYPEITRPEASMDPEILFLDKKSMKDSEVSEDLEEESKTALEGHLIGARIEKLMAEGLVTDKESGKLRPVRYRDIVILLREQKKSGTAIAKVLEARGIPAHVQSATGYFDAYEVQCLLNYLRILDNPYQDIPMAAVLRSPFVGLDEEAMAEIRVKNKEGLFSILVVQEMDACREDRERDSVLRRFTDDFDHFRALSRELPIHELIQHILAETVFGDFCACMPAGEHRAANLDMLIERAIAYEKTSYKGLFHFVRYIDKLQKYEVDYGEADVMAENADVVHIMTIHKSKGLEFPIVFVSLTKQFNKRDQQETMVLHPDLGLGIWESTPTPKTRKPSIMHAQISERITCENLGEELRVLYVALTRAKEKLILTSVVNDMEKAYKNATGNVKEGQPLSYSQRRNAGSYAEWIIPAAGSYPEKYTISCVEPEDLVLQEVQEEAKKQLDRQELYCQIGQASQEAVAEFEKAFSYEYPYPSDPSRKAKYSVSELKHRKMEELYEKEEGEAERPAFLLQDHESYVPVFAQKKAGQNEDGQLTLDLESLQEMQQGEKAAKPAASQRGVSAGALRGTAFHRVMECMDFAAAADTDLTNHRKTSEFCRRELTRMLESGELTDDMRSLISLDSIVRFMQSPCAGRMAKAAAAGRLYRERPFVMLHEDVLIQGIIDVFWLESDENGKEHIALLDYKTDSVRSAEELANRYRTQMDYYKEALERNYSIDGYERKVEETILYSFHFGKEVIL